jgi:glycerol-3-phosphate dehydrogenase (NAD(P)+)
MAVHLAHAGQDVRLWTRRSDQAVELRAGTNGRYLPGVRIPSSIPVHEELRAAVAECDVVLIAVPSVAVRTLARRVVEEGLGGQATLVSLAKGLEESTGRRLSEVLAEGASCGPRRAAVLLGPSHAEEVARGQPTAIVLSGAEERRRTEIQRRLSTKTLRVYTNDDLVGVELAAALKNVLAIAAGICDGLGLGDNTKGALLTRGIAEIARLGESRGGRRETFYGLSGIGDVITTCLSRHSRNRRLGELIGRGLELDAARAEVVQVVEGVETTRTVNEMARREGIPMPIAEQVGLVLFEGREPAVAIEELMSRALKAEWGDGES